MVDRGKQPFLLRNSYFDCVKWELAIDGARFLSCCLPGLDKDGQFQFSRDKAPEGGGGEGSSAAWRRRTTRRTFMGIRKMTVIVGTGIEISPSSGKE